jgi:hypothetical protein
VTRSLARVALVSVFVVAGSTSPRLGAQTPDDLVSACRGAGGGLAHCSAAAVGSQALQGQVALLAGLGSEIGGTSTTLATRIGGGPRLTVGARLGVAPLSLPDPTDETALGEAGSITPAVHVDGALGLFDGFRLMPTVGGFLSVDIFGRAAFPRLLRSDGFDGDATSLTGGVRVGLLREGFTVPGVSVSVSRRWVGSASFGSPGTDPVAFEVDPSVTSFRATVGKDVFAVEWLAGVGRDDVSGRATAYVSNGAAGTSTSSADLASSRWIYFGGAAMTWGVILNVGVEAGWAEGFDPVLAYTGRSSAMEGTPFGSLSLRLVL